MDSLGESLVAFYGPENGLNGPKDLYAVVSYGITMKEVKQERKSLRLSPYLKAAVRYLSEKYNTSQHSIVITALIEYTEKHMTKEERERLNKEV